MMLANGKFKVTQFKEAIGITQGAIVSVRNPQLDLEAK